MSSLESLSDSLYKRLDQVGMHQAVTAAMILEGAKRVLPATYTPKSIRHGVMWIEVPNGAEAYFLKQECDTYVERINAALGQPSVIEIKIRTKHV